MLNPIHKRCLILFVFLVIAGLIWSVLWGCAPMMKFQKSFKILASEMKQLSRMSLDEVKARVDADIDAERLRQDPEGLVGFYVKIQGTVDLEGNHDYPMGNPDDPDEEGADFFLKDTALVLYIDKLPDLKHGDNVEVTGLVSKSRLLQMMQEIMRDEHFPNLATILAVEVRKID